MAPQTRIGFVVLILLVGCILAIPHFRHPIAPDNTRQESKSDASTSALKLKIYPSDSAQKKAVSKSALGVSRGLRLQQGIARTSTLSKAFDSNPPRSIQREQWKFPPVAKPANPENPQPDVGSPVPTAESMPFPFLARKDSPDRPRPIRLPPEAMAPFASADRRIDGRIPYGPTQAAAGNRQPELANDPIEPDRIPDKDLHSRTANVGRSHLVEKRDLRVPDREPALHRIVDGDTLENLALQYYGDPRKAMLIFEKNRNALLNPAILPLGVDLKIPDVDR